MTHHASSGEIASSPLRGSTDFAQGMRPRKTPNERSPHDDAAIMNAARGALPPAADDDDDDEGGLLESLGLAPGSGGGSLTASPGSPSLSPSPDARRAMSPNVENRLRSLLTGARSRASAEQQRGSPVSRTSSRRAQSRSWSSGDAEDGVSSSPLTPRTSVDITSARDQPCKSLDARPRGASNNGLSPSSDQSALSVRGGGVPAPRRDEHAAALSEVTAMLLDEMRKLSRAQSRGNDAIAALDERLGGIERAVKDVQAQQRQVLHAVREARFAEPAEEEEGLLDVLNKRSMNAFALSGSRKDANS